MRKKPRVAVTSLWKPAAYSLSGRLLLLTIVYVLLSEVLIFAPSIGRIHRSILENHILSGELAVMPFNESDARHPQSLPDEIPLSGDSAAPVDSAQALKQSMLRHADAIAITVKRADFRNYYPVGVRPGADIGDTIHEHKIDLGETALTYTAFNGIECLLNGGGRILYVTAPTHIPGAQEIGVFLDETPIRTALIESAKRLIVSGLIVSLITASLVFASLYLFLVRPMRRITQSMIAFRENPEDASRILVPTSAVGEIGQAEAELAAMQTQLFASLRQKTHLAALGTAVARIQHDLRNILSTALIASDRLTASEDPAVKKMAPNLVAAIDRAVNLAANTLKFVRADETPPQRTHFFLKPLIEEVAAIALGTDTPNAESAPIAFKMRVLAETELFADRDQIFRVLLNLIRNAAQALAGRADATILLAVRRGDQATCIDIEDNGPGIPKAARDKLFQPFAVQGKGGGTGLGLAIARELIRAHGGELSVQSSGPAGTVFRLCLPDQDEERSL